MVAEDLAQLRFGGVRRRVERFVQVLQTSGEQRYVQHLGLCVPHVQAQVGHTEPVLGLDQLHPIGWTPLALTDFDAEPHFAWIKVVGELCHQ